MLIFVYFWILEKEKEKVIGENGRSLKGHFPESCAMCTFAPYVHLVCVLMCTVLWSQMTQSPCFAASCAMPPRHAFFNYKVKFSAFELPIPYPTLE